MSAGCQRLALIFTERANETALVYGNRSWTYAELLSEGQRRAQHWQAMGVQPGARVLLLPADRSEFLFAILAGCWGGYELVSVSQKASADELQYIRNVTQPHIEWSGDSGELPTEVAGESTFYNVQVIFFTSGTTNHPKGVCHKFETLLANADAFNRCTGLGESVRMLHVMPNGYMAGLLNTFLSPIMAGGSVVLGDVFDVRSALDFWRTAERGDVNAMWLTPTMVATVTALCRDDTISDWARKNLRYVFVGTAPLHAATRMAFYERLGVDCLESYGMTECMFVSVNPPTMPNPSHSVGLLLPGVEAEARGSDGTVLPVGQEGDLWLRSAYMLDGYLDETSGLPVSAVNMDGWLDTGDIGRLDVDGRMTITGRRKDLIIHGGTNVSPKVVEDVLLGFPGVNDAAVVGAPHPYWGEEVLACVIPETGLGLDSSDLRVHCAARLNPDAIPGRFLILEEFPRSSSGKVQKHVLRKM